MTTPHRQPDPATRFVSHAVVGLAVGAVARKKTGIAGVMLTALLAAAAHEALDAPVAQLLTDLNV